MITREAIEARLQQLQQEATEIRANLNAYEGAIQDCQYWLAQLDPPTTSTPND
jgi:prefoldin subunit 5